MRASFLRVLDLVAFLGQIPHAANGSRMARLRDELPGRDTFRRTRSQNMEHPLLRVLEGVSHATLASGFHAAAICRDNTIGIFAIIALAAFLAGLLLLPRLITEPSHPNDPP
jgi:hypothetical protein